MGEKKTNGGAKVEKDAAGNDIPQPVVRQTCVIGEWHKIAVTDEKKNVTVHDQEKYDFWQQKAKEYRDYQADAKKKYEAIVDEAEKLAFYTAHVAKMKAWKA